MCIAQRHERVGSSVCIALRHECLGSSGCGVLYCVRLRVNFAEHECGIVLCRSSARTMSWLDVLRHGEASLDVRAQSAVLSSARTVHE